MTIDLDTLEAIAKAATPGPWETKAGQDFSEILANSKNIALVGSQHKDAAFIAAANPTTMLALIAELRKRDNAMQRLARALRSKTRALAIAQRECKHAQERAAQKEEKK